MLEPHHFWFFAFRGLQCRCQIVIVILHLESHLKKEDVTAIIQSNIEASRHRPSPLDLRAVESLL
jgi:hypothetical protein